jgi:predicted DNA-binding ArsR family transcriptional regulator
MDLEKLKQEAEALQVIDATSMSQEQLTALVDKLSSLLERSEESLLNTTLLEINKTDNDE